MHYPSVPPVSEAKRNLVAAVALIVLAALSRLLPHPPNLTPIVALALFGGDKLSRRGWEALGIPLAAMVLSDAVIGFHSGMPFVYGAFILVTLLGRWNAKRTIPWGFAPTSLAGATVFFVVSNFGVWVEGYLYPRTLQGLIQCFGAAVPFFGNTVVGTVAYGWVLSAAFRGFGRLPLPAFLGRPDGAIKIGR